MDKIFGDTHYLCECSYSISIHNYINTNQNCELQNIYHLVSKLPISFHILLCMHGICIYTVNISR